MEPKFFMPLELGLSPEQVAIKFGVKRATVYAWISRGELRANKTGSRRYVTEAQLAAFAAQRSGNEYIDMTYAKGPVR
jgi:excisionase family DNA binding protein